MPVTLQPTTLKYKDDNGNWQQVSCLKGEDTTNRLLAPEYINLTFPVAKGTLCMHDSILYSAKQDIAIAEQWTSAHWDEGYVSDAINEKIDKSEIGTVPEGSTVEGQISSLYESITLIQSMIADAESSATAAYAHAVKTVFILNNKLLMALSAIAVGDTITTTGETPNAAEITLAESFPHDVQVNGTSVVQNGVANVPLAQNSQTAPPGVVKVYYGGLNVTNEGLLRIDPAGDTDCKKGTATYTPIAPSRQHRSIYYGLAKLAGADMASVTGETVGVYPSAQLVAIQKMLGIYQAPWELIRSDLVTNATKADIEIAVDSNGQPFELTDLRLMVSLPQQETEAKVEEYGRVRCYYFNNNDDILYIGTVTIAAGGSGKGAQCWIEQHNGMIERNYTAFNSSGSNAPVQVNNSFSPAASSHWEIGTKSYHKIKICAVTGQCRYYLYGKRKLT